ncbi:MAG: peptide deformylase [Pseudomonadota bacterium]
MTVRNVLKMGDARLYQKSVPVADFNSPELAELIDDMLDTMQARDGVGIAAPQIGVFQRVIVMGFEKNPRYPTFKPVPLTTLINLQWEALSDEKVFAWEGCLSVPGVRAIIPRYRKIRYSAYDLKGNKTTVEAEGAIARIIQHECDHIDGILFPQRVIDIRHLAVESEVMHYIEEGIVPENLLQIAKKKND